MSSGSPKFASPEEEIAFWKARVADLEAETKTIKEEFDEFQEGSRELEHEMETQLEQSEAKIKEFRSMTSRIQHENEQLKDKLEQCHKEYHSQVSRTFLLLPVISNSDFFASDYRVTKRTVRNQSHQRSAQQVHPRIGTAE